MRGANEFRIWSWGEQMAFSSWSWQGVDVNVREDPRMTLGFWSEPLKRWRFHQLP